MAIRPLIKKSAPQDSDYESFRAKIALDRNKLDDCTEEQASLFSDVCDRFVMATSRYDESKDELKKIDARLARDIRLDAAKSGEKMTDSICDSNVVLHPDHVEALETLRERKLEADRWDALRDAYRTRTNMIRDLVTLYSASYFTPASLGGPRAAIRDEAAAQGRAKLAEKRRS